MFADAPFVDLPFADIETLYGLALARCRASADFEYVVYAATQQFATNHDDSVLPSQPFRGTLTVPLQIRRSILGSDIGTWVVSDGKSEIDNADGGYDFLPSTYTADGRSIEIKALRRGEDYGAAYVIFRGVMASWFVDEATVAIDLKDNSYKLNIPAQPNLYSGLGGLGGGADLAQKPKPLAFGAVLNISPPLIDAAFLIYQVHDGAVLDIVAVYDRGAAFEKGADFPNFEALRAASIPQGTFVTCCDLGLFRLNAQPAGMVTADVQGDNAGGVFVEMTADIVRRLVARATALLDPDDIDTLSFDHLNTLQPAPVGYFVGVDAAPTVADVVATLMRGIGGWGGFRRNGLFEVRRFDAPVPPALMIFDRNEIIEIKRRPLPDALTPPPWRQRVSSQHNWTVQESDLATVHNSELAGVVSAERAAFLAVADRLSEASSVAVKGDHPFAKDPEPVEAFFRDKVDADVEAVRLLDLFRVERALYELTLPRRALYLNLGDIISVTYPRFDLAAGRLMTVVEISEDLTMSENKIDTVAVTAYG